jgi:hypothetical protein
MKPWLEGQLRRVPPRGGLAEAIRYALARWPALCGFLDDGPEFCRLRAKRHRQERHRRRHRVRANG